MRTFARLFPTACFMLGILFGAAVMACGSEPETKPPPPCLQALDTAEVVIGKATDALDAAGDAINGAVAGDLQAIQAANDKLVSLASTVGDDATKYRDLAAECRGS